MHVTLDATTISSFLRCHEEFRLTYLEGRASAFVAIHREAGIAFHAGAEALWRGKSFPEALQVALGHMAAVDESRIKTTDKRKWEELKGMLPTMLAQYSDTVDTNKEKLQWESSGVCGCGESMDNHSDSFSAGHSPTEQTRPMLELEWQIPRPFGIEELVLVGRIDRVEIGPKLVDVKTASEIDGEDEMGKKTGWERAYRASMAKDFGLGLYDWYLRQIGLVPAEVVLEVVLKPSERYGKKCRVVFLPMPEVLAYRDRFDGELEFICKEILHYVKTYHQMQPWPMNRSACSGKFGNCHFMAMCNVGLNPRTEKLYAPKQEHLSVGKRIEL